MKKIFTTKGTAKPVYRHTWNREEEERQGDQQQSSGEPRPSEPQASSRTSPEKRKQPLSQERRIFKSKMSRTVVSRKGSQEGVEEDEALTQVRCSKSEKEYYTVVKNVKEARQCHEWGEAQEIKADIEYLLGTVVDSENHRVKSLSVINIAAKCQSAQFRAHLRAHGSSMKLFAALGEAPKVPSLAMCTACVIYLLSRDRLGITVDQRTLELIIDLVNLPSDDGRSACRQSASSTDQSEGDEEYENYRMRVWKILNEWRQQSEAAASAALSQGGSSQTMSSSQRSSDNNDTALPVMMFDITLNNLSARFLALEALTFISCRTHDDSFRKWMRESRGLHHIAQYLTKEADTMLALDSKSDGYLEIAIEHAKMLERYLRILEHASLMNQQNQAYLVVWESSSLVFTCAKLLKHFKGLLDQVNINEIVIPEPVDCLPTKTIITVITAVLKTLLNFSHSNVLCCSKLGDCDTFMGDCVDFVTCTIPEHVQPNGRFDLLVLSLGLLINLVEPCNANRRILIAHVGRNGEKTLAAFTKVFLCHEAAAQATDEEVDRVFEGSQEVHERNGTDEMMDVHETVNAALKKASKHMEDSIVASHVALFLGLVLQQNENAAEEITSAMPNRKVEPLIAMLQKFLDFMRLTNAVGRTGEKAIGKAMEVFEHLS